MLSFQCREIEDDDTAVRAGSNEDVADRIELERRDEGGVTLEESEEFTTWPISREILLVSERGRGRRRRENEPVRRGPDSNRRIEGTSHDPNSIERNSIDLMFVSPVNMKAFAGIDIPKLSRTKTKISNSSSKVAKE